MIDLHDSSEATPATPEAAATPSLADFDAQLDAAIDGAFGDESPHDAAAPEPTAQPEPTPEPQATAAETPATEEAPTPAPAADALDVAALRRELSEALEAIRANDRREWEREQHASAHQEERWYQEALAGAKSARDAARKDVRAKARDIYDEEQRENWIEAQYAAIDEQFYDPEVDRITRTRLDRERGAARATIEQIGRGPFVDSLIAKHGLKAADREWLLTPVQTNQGPRWPNGNELVARVNQLTAHREKEALKSEVKRLTNEVARAQVNASGATALPGTGARSSANGFHFEKYDDAENDRNLDLLMARMGIA